MYPLDRPDSTDISRRDRTRPEQYGMEDTNRGFQDSQGIPTTIDGRYTYLDPAYGAQTGHLSHPTQPEPSDMRGPTAALEAQDQLFSTTPDKMQGEPAESPEAAVDDPDQRDQSRIPADQPQQVPALRAPYLQSKPDYVYNMPKGTLLNFTMPEIVALLVNWFKIYPQLTERFVNNGLTSGAHMAILGRHRNMVLCDKDFIRTKDLISDANRRSMRRLHKNWTKATHEVPDDWNGSALSVNHLSHDKGGRNKPIRMALLMDEITMLPQGPDAGDLTRALEYALRTHKRGSNGQLSDWLFPDDLHTILGHIGYTVITHDHLDKAAVERYNEVFKQKEQLERKRRRDLQDNGQTPPPSKRRLRGDRRRTSGTPDPRPAQPLLPAPVLQPFAQGTPPNLQAGLPPSDFAFRGGERLTVPRPGSQTPLRLSRDVDDVRSDAAPQRSATAQENDTQTNAAFAKQVGQAAIPTLTMPFAAHFAATKPAPDFSNGPSQSTTISAIPNIVTVQPQAAEETFTFGPEDVEMGMAEMDAMLAEHQDYNPNEWLNGSFDAFGLDPLAEMMKQYPTTYSDTQILSDCVEADDLEDVSVLARSARWCRDPENHARHYIVGELPFVVTLQNCLEDARKLAIMDEDAKKLADRQALDDA